MDLNNIITVAEAAELTGFGKEYIRYLIRKKKIVGKRIGERMWLVDKVSLEKWVKNNE